MDDPVDVVLQNHANCLTKSCRERGCVLSLHGLDIHSLAIIHGTKYQRQNNFTNKLCDRILFCSQSGCFVAAIELKGGNNINLSNAIQQIQNGLKVADGILQDCTVVDWFPLLVYRGHFGPAETRLLRNKTVEFRGKRKSVIRRHCGSELIEVL